MSPDRIEMNVTDQFQEIGVLLAEDGLVSCGKQVADPFVPAIKEAGITGKDRAHDAGEGKSLCLDEEMEMVSHESVSVEAIRESFSSHGQALDKSLKALFVLKDDLAVIAPGDDVIEGAGELNPRFAGHGAMVRQITQNRKTVTGRTDTASTSASSLPPFYDCLFCRKK
jgi:hypothetical protein